MDQFDTASYIDFPDLLKYLRAIFSGNLTEFLTYAEKYSIEAFRGVAIILLVALIVNILLNYIYKCTGGSKMKIVIDLNEPENQDLYFEEVPKSRIFMKSLIIISDVCLVISLIVFISYFAVINWLNADILHILQSSGFVIVFSYLLVLKTCVLFREKSQNLLIIDFGFLLQIAIIVTLLTAFMITISSGVCKCIHSELIPGFKHNEVHFSTALSRYWTKEICPEDKMPCLVYATLPEEAGTGVFINFHTNIKS